MNFKEFINLQEENPGLTVGTHNDGAGPFNNNNSGGAITDAPGQEGHSPISGQNDAPLDKQISLAKMNGQGYIRSIGQTNSTGEPTENPIPIKLDDGSELSLSLDQYKRIGRPKKGMENDCFFLDSGTTEPASIQSIEITRPDGQIKKYQNGPISIS